MNSESRALGLALHQTGAAPPTGAAVATASSPALRRPKWRFRLPRTFSSLAVRDFRQLWIGIVLMMGSMQMMGIAQGFLAYQLTGSAKILGFVYGGMALPMLVLAPFGGALADRWERKRILQVGQTISATLAVAIGVSIVTGLVTWVYLLVGGMIQAALWSFMAPARQSLVPMMVPKMMMGNAVALGGAGMSVSSMAAPGVGGVLYALLGPEGVYFVVTAMALGGLMFTSSLPTIAARSRDGSRALLSEIKAGLVYIASNRIIRGLLSIHIAVALLASPLHALLPVLVVDVYGRQSEAFGLMISVMGIGSLIGALTIASMGEWKRGLLILSSGLVTAGILIAVSVSPWYMLSVGFMMVMGLSHGGQWSLNQALAMGNADEAYRGRVMSIFMMSYGLIPLGVLPAAIVADAIGAQLTLGIVGAALLVISTLFLLTLRRLRELQ